MSRAARRLRSVRTVTEKAQSDSAGAPTVDDGGGRRRTVDQRSPERRTVSLSGRLVRISQPDDGASTVKCRGHRDLIRRNRRDEARHPQADPLPRRDPAGADGQVGAGRTGTPAWAGWCGRSPVRPEPTRSSPARSWEPAPRTTSTERSGSPMSTSAASTLAVSPVGSEPPNDTTTRRPSWVRAPPCSLRRAYTGSSNAYRGPMSLVAAAGTRPAYRSAVRGPRPVLVDEHVTGVRTIGEIVDHHGAAGALRSDTLPALIEAVVVDDEDVDSGLHQPAHHLRIAPLRPARPHGPGRCWIGIVGSQDTVPVPTLRDLPRHCVGKRPGEEVDLGAVPAHLGGEGETPGEVAHADVEPAIDSEHRVKTGPHVSRRRSAGCVHGQPRRCGASRADHSESKR